MVTIQRISHDELDLLQVIAKETFIDTYADQNTPKDVEDYLNANFTADQLTTELNNPESLFFLAKKEGQVVGYLKLNIGQAQTELTSHNSLEIERIYVQKGHQGEGIGQILFDHAVKTARTMDTEFVWLGVWEHNTRAIGFYERMGFKAFDTHAFMFGNTKQTDIMMKLELTG